MGAEYPSISAGSATVTRNGGTVTVKVTFTAYNGNSSGVAARYLQIRTGGSSYTSGANASSYSVTNTTTVSSYGSGSVAIGADLYYQITTGYPFQYQSSASRTASYSAAQFTVTFDPGAGTTPTPTKTVTYGSTYGELPTPVRSGYAFLGWFDDPSAGNKIEPTDTVSITSDTTLYAHWDAMSIMRVVENGTVTTFTKIYSVQGGTANRVLGLYVVSNGTVKQCT